MFRPSGSWWWLGSHAILVWRLLDRRRNRLSFDWRRPDGLTTLYPGKHDGTWNRLDYDTVVVDDEVQLQMAPLSARRQEQ